MSGNEYIYGTLPWHQRATPPVAAGSLHSDRAKGSLSAMTHFRRRLVTHGERLCEAVIDSVYELRALRRESSYLFSGTRRKQRFSEFYFGVIALHFTARLIRLADHARVATSPGSIEEQRAMKDLIADKLELNKGNCSNIDQLANLSLLASLASDRPIGAVVKANLRDEFRTPHCYICGTPLVHGNAPNEATWDHLWPSAYGGDSVADNLMPACGKCNERKADMISWEWSSVHRGAGPVGWDFHRFPKTSHIALHLRAAADVAEQSRCTLKDALKILGPPKPTPWALDSEDTTDFFNLTVHDLTEHDIYWTLE
jgi:hypothetical protein